MRDWPELRNSVIVEHAAGPRLFVHPERIIQAHAPEEIPGALARMDEAVNAGFYLAGFFSYDTGPLVWFGCYRGFEPAELSENGRYSLSFRGGDMDRDAFVRNVEHIRSRIQDGFVYQVNLTRREFFDFSGNPLSLFARLRRLQASPYAAFARTEASVILSLSPELFFRVERLRDSEEPAWVIETHPMKGTAGLSTLDGEILSDEKTLSENHMILDLMRNDLGRIARPGSFQVEPSRIIELSTLKQMISVVRAKLNECSMARIYPALFPPGSVTGAPKVAAMKLIRSLESPRGIYTGSVGFIAPHFESAQFNVAIRTLVIQGRRAVYGTGCGIVWDSNAETEWRESQLKTAFLRAALDSFHVIETLRMDEGRTFLLIAHLRRMRNSARRFSLSFPLREILEELQQIPADLSARIRIAVYRERFEVAATEAPTFRRIGIARIRISEETVQSDDPFRAHKTSERAIYDEGLRAARDAGLDDALFLNERGEVVETAIGNVLVRMPEGWVTPHKTCGALPGVMLGELMRRFPGKIRQGVIKRADLSGRRVLICNSVRGILRARIQPDSESG